MEVAVRRDAALRSAYYLSLAVLGLLLLGSIVWYKQRVLFLDPAWISFQIVNRGEFIIPEHRYGAVVTQIWPWLSAHLHLPLRLILILYSASFYIFYLVVALLLGRLRQYALGLLFVLYLTLLVSDVYFWPNNEVHQGIGWMMLFLGPFFCFQKRGAMPWWLHPLLMIALFMALFSHFIVIVALSFLWIYWLLYNPSFWDTRRKKIQIAAYTLAATAIFLVKLNLGRTGWYDGEKLGPVLNVKPKEIIASFANGGAATMGNLILRNYWIILPIFFVGTLALIRLRQWGRLTLYLAYVAGFFSLVCLTYPNAYGHDRLFYMESEWMAWGILLATPFVLHALPALRPRWSVVAAAFIFAVRLFYIGQSFSLFDKRYRSLETISEWLKQQGITKAVLVAEKQKSEALFLMDWAVGFESTLLSVLKGDHPLVSFHIATPDYVLPQPSAALFISSNVKGAASELNTFYYQIDTTKPYRRLDLIRVVHAAEEAHSRQSGK